MTCENRTKEEIEQKYENAEIGSEEDKQMKEVISNIGLCSWFLYLTLVHTSPLENFPGVTTVKASRAGFEM